MVSNDSETYLLDVTPLTLRLGLAGDMTEPIIERNSPVPVDHTRIFTTVQDYQETISVQIFQGEERAIEGNALLGEFEFAGFEPGPRGQVQIEVTFAINTEGIVKVSARDPKNGVEASTTVSMSSGLSEDEIRAIMERNQEGPVTAADVIEEPDGADPDLLPLPPASTASDEEEFLALPEVEPVDAPTEEPADTGELFGAVGESLAAVPEVMPLEPTTSASLDPPPGPLLDPSSEPIELGGADPDEPILGVERNGDFTESQVDEQLSDLFEDDVVEAELVIDIDEGDLS